MTEEEFKETEVYKLLMNDIDIKFGTMVNNLLPFPAPPPPIPIPTPTPSMLWPGKLPKLSLL